MRRSGSLPRARGTIVNCSKPLRSRVRATHPAVRTKGEHSSGLPDQPRQSDRRVSVVSTSIKPSFAPIDVRVEPAKQGAFGGAQDGAGVVVPGGVNLRASYLTGKNSMRAAGSGKSTPDPPLEERFHPCAPADRHGSDARRGFPIRSAMKSIRRLANAFIS
jgi:hypothetical protein